MVAITETRYDTGRGGGLVPGSWELVCRNRKEYVAARHVVTFDVGADHSVVYSNGYGVFRLVDGEWRRSPVETWSKTSALRGTSGARNPHRTGSRWLQVQYRPSARMRRIRRSVRVLLRDFRMAVRHRPVARPACARRSPAAARAARRR
jgi:hypothetical protein